MDDIGLLLAHADNDEPVLQKGLDFEAAAKGPAPKQRKHKDDDGFPDLRADGAEPNDLAIQRWGVVIPDSPEGDRLLEAIEPLRKKREEDQGHKPIVYRVKTNEVMDAEGSSTWWSETYHDDDIADEATRPRYLLILGGPDLVSWDFQQRLALDIFVGRLAFPDRAGYEAYANKVVKYERMKAEDGARALFYTVRDGTAATNAGHAGLMLPSVETARKGMGGGTFNAKEIDFLNDRGDNVGQSDLLEAVAVPTPTMLFSISHGLGAPRKGWGSLEEQHRFQGAMSFGGGQRLTHEDVANRSFLPGGAWFFFACLGAGTPSESAYRHWLQKLKEISYFAGSPDAVLASLPRPDELPFVSRLPQAALANEQGPLSIVGHVDLAWTFSFQEYSIKDGKRVTRNKARFHDIFRSLVDGGRMGAAYTALQRYFSNTNTDLTTIFDREARAQEKGLPIDDSLPRKLKKASLWMERQDLSAYVLLGDPAVRLNVNPARAQPGVSAPIPELRSPEAPPAPPATPASGVKKLSDIEAMEMAILRVLDDRPVAKEAAKLEVGTDDVMAWVKAYQDAGREALKKL
jgi:hypothetical protein